MKRKSTDTSQRQASLSAIGGGASLRLSPAPNTANTAVDL